MYTLQNLLKITGHQVDKETLRFATLGFLIPLFSERPALAFGNLRWHKDRILAAIALDQLRLCFDQFGRFCGHVLWTSVAPDMESVLLKHGSEAIEGNHFSDGDNIWILDMGSHGGKLNNLLSVLRDDWLADAPAVTYLRVKNGRRLAKRLSRNSISSFFRAPHTEEFSDILARQDGSGLLHSCREVVESAIEAGQFFELMGETPEMSQLPIAMVVARLRAPLNLRQRKLYFGTDGKPAGFITWAWLENDTVTPKPIHALQPFEWNEGESLCLMDAVALPDAVAEMQNDLACSWFHGEAVAVYGRSENSISGKNKMWSVAERSLLASELGVIKPPINLAMTLTRGEG